MNKVFIGKGRYIAEDDFLNDLQELCEMLGWDETEERFSFHDIVVQMGISDNYHRADVRKAIHANWIDTSPPPVDEGRLPEWIEYTCSACGKGRVVAMTRYCYFCGAKMDNYGKMKGTKNDGKK